MTEIKLSDSFKHIKQFGVIGSGDETTKIQTAVDSLEPGELLKFEPGKKYSISSPILVNGVNGLCLYGYGATLHNLNNTAGNCIEVSTTLVTGSYLGQAYRILGFFIQGVTGSGHGIYVDKAHRGIIKDIVIPGLGGKGIVLNGAMQVGLENIFVSKNIRNLTGDSLPDFTGGFKETEVTYPPNMNIFRNCHIEGGSGDGFDIKGNSNSLFNCVAQGITGSGRGFALGGEGHTLIGGWSEGNAGGDFFVGNNDVEYPIGFGEITLIGTTIIGDLTLKKIGSDIARACRLIGTRVNGTMTIEVNVINTRINSSVIGTLVDNGTGTAVDG